MTLKGFVDSILAWIDSKVGDAAMKRLTISIIQGFSDPQFLNLYYETLPPGIKDDPAIIEAYTQRKDHLEKTEQPLLASFSKEMGTLAMDYMKVDMENPDDLAKGIDAAIEKWKGIAGGFKHTKTEEAQMKMSILTAKMIELMTATAAIDIGLGMLPNDAGSASALNTKRLISMLGAGAVITATLHDPVKIGLLRPYNRALEATFRNKGLDDRDIYNAYLQRSLSATPITNIDQITDEMMDQIEQENHVAFGEDLARHGYSDELIAVLEDAQTRALNFGALAAMARMGHYNRKLAIFSLWTDGIDRRVMYPALDALETMRDVGLWKGFRSMVEPAYVQGLIEETDLREYWTRILVPGPVQDWTILKLTKARVKFLEKEAKQLAASDRIVSEAKYTKAYKLKILSKEDLTAALTARGYDNNEISLLIAIADAEQKPTATAACKKLPLSDYELAHRNGLATTQDIIDRMTGEYCQKDIDLEVQLIAIDDLTSEAPATERDLAAGTVTTAYIEGIRTKEQAATYLTKLGFDDAEVTWLLDIAEIKKETWEAKRAKEEALAEAKAAKLTLQQARAGLKRLPLSDYEKAQAYNLITEQDVLDRMVGEYDEFDIGLEKLMITAGIARKG